MARRKKKRKTVDFPASETTPLRRIIALLCYAAVGLPLVLPFVFAREGFMRHHAARAIQMILVYAATVLVFANFVYVVESPNPPTESGDATFFLVGLPTIFGFSIFIFTWTCLVIYFSWFSVMLPVKGKAWNLEPGLVTIKWSLIFGVTAAGFGLLIGALAHFLG
ncbi:MAG: hypothetical protein JSW52_09560 [Candidatus Coatesbacteria bacterium]|nr:MAG: hypothetical protein JSW52_09560 [Candidatus Coatesbacteria bacterium]